MHCVGLAKTHQRKVDPAIPRTIRLSMIQAAAMTSSGWRCSLINNQSPLPAWTYFVHKKKMHHHCSTVPQPMRGPLQIQKCNVAAQSVAAECGYQGLCAVSSPNCTICITSTVQRRPQAVRFASPALCGVVLKPYDLRLRLVEVLLHLLAPVEDGAVAARTQNILVQGALAALALRPQRAIAALEVVDGLNRSTNVCMRVCALREPVRNSHAPTQSTPPF